MKLIKVFISLSIFLFIACSSDDEVKLESLKFQGFEYAPLKVGQESIFDIDSIIYNEFTGRVDTLRIQERELIKEQIVDASGRPAFLAELYRRNSDTLNWSLIRVLRKTKTNQRLEILDNNQLRVDLVFPIINSRDWNKNSLNSESPTKVSFEKVNEPFMVGIENYDSTATVFIREEENLIEQIFTNEVYGIGKGLIYRRDKNLETELNGKVRSGYDVTIQLIEFKEQ